MNRIRVGLRAAVVFGGISLLGCSASTASTTDAGAADLGRQDAGLDDAGSDAGGPPDLGVDAGPPDAGPPDAGPPDAGPPDAGPTDTEVVDIDFESGSLPSFVAIDTCMSTPSQGYAPLGTPGNTFGPTFIRCLTGSVITVTLADLPPHTSLSLDFLFAAIDSLDGEGSFPAGDYFRIALDGVTIFREAFANATPTQIQTYEPPVPEIVLARRIDLGFTGPGSFYTDSAYDMSLDPQFDDLPHTASTAVITFTLEGTGVQSLEDESWAIDNLRVTTGTEPRVRPDAGP